MTTQKHTNRNDPLLSRQLHSRTGTTLNQKLLLGKSQISYQCKYRHIYKKPKLNIYIYIPVSIQHKEEESTYLY